MNLKKEKAVKNSLNKSRLAAAVSTAMFGVISIGSVQAATVTIGDMSAESETITLEAGSGSSGNITNNYALGSNGTLIIGSNMTSLYGTIDGANLVTADNGTISDDQRGNVTIEGATLTLYGNVGATRGTGNFTIEAGSTVTLADNMTTFRTTNLTIGTGSKLYLGGNSSRGYNRIGESASNSLTLTSNITMRTGSTIFAGNGTTITGEISGESAGAGSLNLVGNFTTGGQIGGSNKLAEISIGNGNTLFLGHNASATTLYANGTITTQGGNFTGSTYLGENGVLNLFTDQDAGNQVETAPAFNGIIEGLNGRNGTIHINGTFATQANIGGNSNGLDAIYIDSLNNRTTNPYGTEAIQTAGHASGTTVTFNHDVNATSINVGQVNSQNNNTLKLGNNIKISGAIEGSGNSSAKGNLQIIPTGQIIMDGGIGGTNGISNVTIDGSALLTLKSSTFGVDAVQLGGGSGNATLALNATGTYTITSTIDGNVEGQGAGLVKVNNGTVTFSGAIGGTQRISAVQIGRDATMTATANISVNDTIILDEFSVLNLSSGADITVSDSADGANNNITLGKGSVLNIKSNDSSNTTITANIVGHLDGQGTVNVYSNMTSGGKLGGVAGSANDLGTITIHTGNTYTSTHNASATNIYVNGTINALSTHANMTGSVYIGDNGKVYLQNGNQAGDAAHINGTIDGGSDSSSDIGGKLYINGTYVTQGVIGATRALEKITLDSSNPSSTAHTYTFAHSVNATNIYLGTSSSSKNATLRTSKSGDSAHIIITGNIVGGGNYTSGSDIASGILDINSNTDVTGTIGTSDYYLADVRIAGAKTLTVKDTIYSNNITFESGSSTTSNSTIAFNGTSTSSYSVKSIISSASAGGSGLIDINSGNWTFDNEIGTRDIRIGALRIEDGAWANFSKDVSTNESITINGTMNITGSLSLTAMDDSGKGYGINFGNGTSLGSTNATLQISDDAVLTIGSKSSAGASQGDGATFSNATIRLKGAGAQSYSSNSSAAINIGANNQTVVLNQLAIDMLGGDNSTYTDGQVVNIIGRGSDSMNNGTLTVTGSVSVVDSSAMLSFSENSATFKNRLDNSTSALQVTVNYVSSSTLGLTGNNKAVYDVAKTAISNDNEIFGALSSMPTNADVDSAIATMHPATGGAAAASASISGSSMGTASTRMAYTRQTNLGRGMNAGGTTLDESMWLQVFGADVDQDNVGGISGYDADGQGLAIGIDGMSEDGTTRIGIAGSFANTDVTGKDTTTKTTTDIDTTQIMAYANKVNDDGSYLEGTASLAFNDNTGTRRILVGAVDRTASSAYDSTTFGVNVEAGWPKENDGVTVTPTLGLAYSSTSADAYTETGAGNMNLNVTPTDYSTFEGKAGVKVTGRSVDADGGIGRPEVRIGVTHNFGDDTADSTATFTAGGSSFTTKGVETDSTKVDLGLGYTYTNPEGDTDISVNIDGRKSSSYLQYGGGLTVKWKF